MISRANEDRSVQATTPSYSSIRREMQEIVEQIELVDIRSYEALELDDQVRRIHPIATTLLAQGENLLGRVLASTDPTTRSARPSSLPFELAMDAAVLEPAPTAVLDICDIAFCAHLELQQRAQRLREVVRSDDPITLLGECDSALRRICKALSAIDVAIARASHTEPLLDFRPELQRSLRVRRYYARFRKRISDGLEPTPRTLLARLRSVGTAIAVLVGQHVYAELRVGDRLQLRSLQRRVLTWLRTQANDSAIETGFQLWSDVEGFVNMLGQVNQRQELLEHDAAVLCQALDYVTKDGARLLSTEIRQQLDRLAGLDPAVDDLLESDQVWEVEVWRPVLESLASSFGGRDLGT